MICRDMRAIIKNVEHPESEDKFVVVKAVADDNMLWYYGRFPNVDKAMEVARDITSDGIVGFVVFDDMLQSKEIKMAIDCADEFSQFNELKEIDLIRCKAIAFDQIKEIINDGTGIHKTS